MSVTRKKADRPVQSEATPPLLEDGMITDFIIGRPVKETDKEKVRQEVAVSSFSSIKSHPRRWRLTFPVEFEGKRKRADIAIFDAGKEHTIENLRRAVICRPLAVKKQYSGIFRQSDEITVKL
jgi:type I restriction enzyme M protein